MDTFLMVVTDAHLEESFRVFGQSREVLARAAVTYLRHTKPKHATTGEPIDVPAYLLDADAWLKEICWDLDDIDIEIIDERGIHSVPEFLEWISDNTEPLAKMHRALDVYRDS